MKSFNEWKEKKDGQGGLIPEDMKRAKHVDLITLPTGVEGTNCGNCKFNKDDFCDHKEIQMHVNDRMCCKYWDHTGVKRAWGKMED